MIMFACQSKDDGLNVQHHFVAVECKSHVIEAWTPHRQSIIQMKYDTIEFIRSLTMVLGRAEI